MVKRTKRFAEALLWKRAGLYFWKHVAIGPEDACWLWTGTRQGRYGTFDGCRAHRMAWQVANERKIPDGLHVLHSCDVPMCCNPKHLRVGTHAENMADKARRGRAGKGVSKPKLVINRQLVGMLSMPG